VRLAEAVREAVRQIREAAQAAKIDVRILPMPEIEVNAAVIELCIKNYLSNAIKYSDPKKKERYVSIAANVEMRESGKRELVLRVRDNGLGVPVEKREHLFERFFRAHDTVDVEGTGLGLNIVREIAEAQGGRAWAEYPPDGTVFCLALPLRREKETTAEHAVPVKAGASG